MRREVMICFGLAAITLAVFWPISRHDFINLDDPDYVTQNQVVQAGLSSQGLLWAFGASHANNWHPLTWLSHMLDCQLFGLKPGAHHLTSLGLHIASTLLLFLALNQMTGAAWRSATVAALFAWHPLHIESVAWVAERKDVLSAFFFMLTLWAYACYAQKSEARTPKPEGHPKLETRATKPTSRKPAADDTPCASCATPTAIFHLLSSVPYLLALLFFALGLMCKPMLVTLPFVLLLLDYWPLGRLQLKTQDSRLKTFPALLLEKAPFFILALAAGLLTLRAQHVGGAITSLEQLPVTSRLANAPVACWAYLGKTLWPANLSVFYPHVPVPAWQAALSALLLLCLTILCLAQARSRPWLVAGWFWFGVMLLPVIGLVQVGWQALADRYTYLPLVGVFIMLAWGAGGLALRSTAWRFGLALSAVLILAACLVLTRSQLKHWQDSVALFSHALKVTRANWLAHNNLGTTIAEQGKLDEAAEHFRAALKVNPTYDDALNNLGRFLAERGQLNEAKARLEDLVRRNPRHAGAHRNLGYVLLAQGNLADGVSHYATARRLRPDDEVTTGDLANALIKLPESQTAMPHLLGALDLLPSTELRAHVAGAWAGQGKFHYAVQAHRAALAAQPQSPEILNNLAWLLATCPEADLRDGAQAVQLATHACELTQFQRTVMVGTLAAAYAEVSRFDEAVATAQKACALAAESGDETLVRKNQQLLEQYRAGRPYREAANPATPEPVSSQP
jgi:protein O-mannosyl-transferase